MARYQVTRRSAEDEETLFRLYEDVFGKARADASRLRWRWQYLDNPRSLGHAAVWVAREGPKPLGQMGTMPVALWWGGRETEASWGMDYFVSREAEGRGLGPLLAKAWGDNVEIALAMGLTPPAYAVYKRLGFQDVGAVPFFLALLDPTAVARRRLGWALGSVVGPLLRLALALRYGRGTRVSTRLQVRRVSDVGPGYDGLWERARASYAMCVRRDAAYLRWKYLECPHRRYDLFEARRGDELLGFAVSRQEDYQGLRLGWIVDVFAEAADSEVKRALIAATLETFSASGVARAQAYCLNAALASDLRLHGFFAGRSKALFCVKSREASNEAFSDLDRWHVTFGDGDMDR